MLKGLLLGIVLGVVLIVCCVYFYFSTGAVPVATTDAPMALEIKFAHMALNARIQKAKIPPSRVAADEKSFLSGADVYKEHCAVCHGLPDQPKTFIAEGMYPKPPQLFHGTGVSDDPASETYWKVENGIRLTGMPGFKGRLTEDQIWQVSVLLANSDKIPTTVKAALITPLSAQSVPPATSAAPTKIKP
jgi:mono/diheme cytochrome c family protein